MPYTLAHPAAIVPLHRLLGRRVPLSALAIGSMAPDFPYFLGGVTGPFSHGVPGMVFYCLPAGLLVYLLFHLLLKQPSAALLPERLVARLPDEFLERPELTLDALGAVLLGIAIGVLTHVLWDGFTHPDTFIVQHVEILQTMVGVWGQHEVLLCEALQYGFSGAGLAALAWWLRRWLRRTPIQSRPAGRCLSLGGRLVVYSAMAIGACAGCLAAGLRGIAFTEAFLVIAIISAMKGGGAAWLAYCVAWHARAAAGVRASVTGVRASVTGVRASVTGVRASVTGVRASAQGGSAGE